jgi:hypothetical protein
MPRAALRGFVYDVRFVALAVFDYFISPSARGTYDKREFAGRFAIGDKANINLRIENASARDLHLKIKTSFRPK